MPLRCDLDNLPQAITRGDRRMTILDKAILDKAKAAAGRAGGQARHGLEIGQQRLTEVQERRRYAKLLRDLGEAYYAEHRGEAGHEPVIRALAALDVHVQAHRPSTPGTAGEQPELR
jgi:hypothetical protein